MKVANWQSNWNFDWVDGWTKYSLQNTATAVFLLFESSKNRYFFAVGPSFNVLASRHESCSRVGLHWKFEWGHRHHHLCNLASQIGQIVKTTAEMPVASKPVKVIQKVKVNKEIKRKSFLQTSSFLPAKKSPVQIQMLQMKFIKITSEMEEHTGQEANPCQYHLGNIRKCV